MFEIHDYTKNNSHVDTLTSINDPSLVNAFIKNCKDYYYYLIIIKLLKISSYFLHLSMTHLLS